jgi:glycosyltransferase involved in cell wall biosynthesis
MATPLRSVCLLFRQPGRFFSIERIFQQLRPILEHSLRVNTTEAAYSRMSPHGVLANIRSAQKCKADIYHVTGDIHYVVLGLPRRRTLLTIHDCVFLYSATGIKGRVLKWLFLDMPVRRCTLITTISEATRKDILSFTGCQPGKVVVIPNPVADTIYYSPATFRTEEPVILFMGTTDNKNLFRVAQALNGLACRLEIVGKLNAVQERALADQHILYRQHAGLSDEQVAACYAEADMVLFPSTFEGFGLPIVEGQKAGRPVITSDLSPMKEVAGEAACLVDPYDPGSIRTAVLKVMSDAAYREQLIKDGLRNVERFSAETIAAQYLTCYKKLANQ